MNWIKKKKNEIPTLEIKQTETKKTLFTSMSNTDDFDVKL